MKVEESTDAGRSREQFTLSMVPLRDRGSFSQIRLACGTIPHLVYNATSAICTWSLLCDRHIRRAVFGLTTQ